MIMTVRTFLKCWRTDSSMLLVLFVSLSTSPSIFVGLRGEGNLIGQCAKSI